MVKEGVIKHEGSTKAGKVDNNQIEREECVVHNIEQSFIACRAHRSTPSENQYSYKMVFYIPLLWLSTYHRFKHIYYNKCQIMQFFEECSLMSIACWRTFCMKPFSYLRE